MDYICSLESLPIHSGELNRVFSFSFETHRPTGIQKECWEKPKKWTSYKQVNFRSAFECPEKELPVLEDLVTEHTNRENGCIDNYLIGGMKGDAILVRGDRGCLTFGPMSICRRFIFALWGIFWSHPNVTIFISSTWDGQQSNRNASRREIQTDWDRPKYSGPFLYRCTSPEWNPCHSQFLTKYIHFFSQFRKAPAHARIKPGDRYRYESEQLMRQFATEQRSWTARSDAKWVSTFWPLDVYWNHPRRPHVDIIGRLQISCF
jgi:hypothetical protein